jgi:RHS repeat-associated protein
LCQRESFPASGGSFLEQVTQYYPSGLPWWEGRMPETQNRKYNGKEFVEAHGYDTYDYGARGYYPAIMRFTTVDPLAEKKPWLSPYNYCSDNPVNRVDPDGNRDWPVGVTYKGYQRSHLDNFGEQRGNRMHQGLDINLGSGYDDYGAPVYATHDGTVTRIATIDNGDTNAGGNRVQITSADGEVSTYYMHLGAVAEGVKVGAAIAEGVQIGTLGASAFGSTTGTASHLHYELRVNGELTNPAISPTQLIDPQTLIATVQLPEVTVTAKGPNKNQQLPVQEMQIPEIKKIEEQK